MDLVPPAWLVNPLPFSKISKSYTIGFSVASSIETSDGTSANVGSAMGGIGYSLGWYF